MYYISFPVTGVDDGVCQMLLIPMVISEGDGHVGSVFRRSRFGTGCGERDSASEWAPSEVMG
jgi:hypothetical protein